VFVVHRHASGLVNISRHDPFYVPTVARASSWRKADPRQHRPQSWRECADGKNGVALFTRRFSQMIRRSIAVLVVCLAAWWLFRPAPAATWTGRPAAESPHQSGGQLPAPWMRDAYTFTALARAI
jgi:hypothetical protein